MTRTWRYVDPGPNNEPVCTTVTDEEILKTFYPWWKEQMIKAGKEDQISPEECIMDYVVVNWAEEVK